MATPGRNEGFRVLDDFICEAIHDSAIPIAKPENQGKNEGMSVVEELVFDASAEGKSSSNNDDSPKRVISINDVARPLSTGGWSRMFAGAAAAAVFSGIVGGVLRAFGSIASFKDSSEAEKACQLCGRSDAAYSLRCCHSVTCEGCLSRMFTPQQEDGVGFHCAICGHVHTEATSA